MSKLGASRFLRRRNGLNLGSTNRPGSITHSPHTRLTSIPPHFPGFWSNLQSFIPNLSAFWPESTMWKPSERLMDTIRHYASFPATGVSLRQMVQFGDRPSTGMCKRAPAAQHPQENELWLILITL